MPTPSLLIVPARFKTGRLYSQIPTNTDNRGDFTVTRNTAARRFNSAGLIESVASGIPRLDYYTSGGVTGCPALLVEPAATNLHTYSEAFDQNYTAIATTISGTNLTAPDNSSTADRYFENAGVSTHVVALAGGGAGFAVTSGTVYTISAFIKGIGGRNSRFSVTNAGSGNVLYTLSGNGSVSNSSIGAIQYFGNDWYRCSLTFTATGTTNFRQSIFSVSGSTDSFDGDPTKGIMLWGAQLETGSVATSYIPTTTGTGSRSADVISVSGAVSGSIGQLSGTIYAEMDVRVLGDGRFATLSDGTSNNRIQCRFNSAINGLDFLVVVSGSSVGFSVSNSTHPSFPVTIPAGTYKIALGYKQNDYVVAMNGVTYTPTVTTRNVPLNFSKVTLGADVSDLNQFNNRIRAVALYTTRLTNAELATLTA